MRRYFRQRLCRIFAGQYGDLDIAVSLVTLNTEQLVKSAPLDVRGDASKMQDWMESVRASLESQIAGLNPESGLVVFDTVKADYLNSEIGASADYGPFVDIVDGQTATALRTPPSILGKRMGGTQSVSSSESLLFLKHVEGIHKPVEAVFSRALTLAMRLLVSMAMSSPNMIL